MESILGVVQSPVFLGLLLSLGMASLVMVLLSRDPSLKRAHSCDCRRQNVAVPEMPFQDSDGVLVTADRRVQPDRRRSRLLAMQHQMQRDNVPG